MFVNVNELFYLNKIEKTYFNYRKKSNIDKFYKILATLRKNLISLFADKYIFFLTILII